MTTAFKIFTAEVKRLSEIYNLRDWHIGTECRKLDGGGGRIDFEVEHNFAIITLHAGIRTGAEARQIARHEVFHLFTARLEALAAARYIHPSAIGEEVERMARIFERLNVEEAEV